MRTLRWTGALLAGLLAVASIVVMTASIESATDARRALEGAERLYAGRLAVARAEEQLGSADASDAAEGARRANAVALRVKARIGALADGILETAESARVLTSATEEGTRSAEFARRQTTVVADALAAIAAYQRAATRYSADNNVSLRRILDALRKTNEQFEDGP